MNTFSSTNIIQKNIITKPYLLTTEELSQIGSGINLVGYDFLKTLPTPIDETIVNFKYGNSCSPRLLNWVEPYKIAGIDYTLFYTEVNSGLKVNDKVFIINGAYDSNLLIKEDKYKKGRDGYKVLFVDECRIVLDIEFIGWLPANETSSNQELLDDFIKVYYIKDENEFVHVNRQVTTRGGSFSYKFNQNQNNIIFTDKDYLPVLGWGENMGLTGSPGFFVKNNLEWINITNLFIQGSYSIAATSSNNKILILNGSFVIDNLEFNEDSVYVWDSKLLTWVINVKHENNNPPIITKSNFRNGQFDGQWNGGLYGTNEKRIIWDSDTATWNSGTLLNTVWKTGILNSFYTQPESYFSEFDYSFITTSTPYGLPYQKVNNPDNNGYGYNFIINSDIQNAVINNGNVTNSKLGLSASSYNIVEEYLKNSLDLGNFGTASGLTVNKALFDNCKFINANIENTEIRNCRAENSRFNKVKSVNSHYKSSLFTNSNYISDNIIKVLDYDEFTYSSDDLSETHKVYKFYINKRSYEKFKLKDIFYIKGIKINDNSGDLVNFFDTKFKIGPWREYIDLDINSNGFSKFSVEYNAFISTPKENEYKYSVNSGNELFEYKNKDYYSVDIFISLKYENVVNEVYAKDFNNTFLGTGILDFSEAYIVNSDFESGVFENSNWNSGNHINHNNDNNITKDIINGGGFYDLKISNNTLLVNNTISTNGILSEVEYDYFENNSIVFINAVDYDTRGKVIDFIVTSPGSGYINSTINTTGGEGTGLVFDIVASTIGAVSEVQLISDNNNYYEVTNGYNIRTTTGGSGTGLTVLITVDNLFYITSVSIDNTGSGYLIGDEIEISLVSINEGPNRTKFTVTNILNGAVLNSSTILSQGLGYKVDDEIELIGGDDNAMIKVIAITGSLTRLPDAYKVKNRTLIGTNQTFNLEPISGFPSLLEDGLFLTTGAQNKYGYLHKTKFYRSRIITGIFKRAYIVNSLLKDESFDVSDKDFNNIKKIKNLIFIDTIFSNNQNILSKATYMNSFLIGGNDIWENGILYDSIWNGGNFRNGLVKESVWINGTFSDGLFYNSRSFNNNSIFDYNENIKTRYYKSGTESNTRFSWQDGQFLNGEFYKSDWENGVFNNGKFYYSKFYNGLFNNGIIGDKSISIDDTFIYNGIINYATVENSKVISEKYNGVTNSNIIWNNGIFNSGIFGVNDEQLTVNYSTWNNGIFNGGEFRNTSKWKDGIFNGGKFLSHFGLNLSEEISTMYSPSSYSWEYGIFNGGEFGNADTTTNSTWFDGEFNGGQFKGRIWNNGIFSFGEFIGSGATAIGGIPSVLSQSNPNMFVKSYTDVPKKYYGLWRNGYVTDIKDKYITSKKIYTDIKRSSDTSKVFNKAIFKNILWLGGTFSHLSGEITNSVWLDGVFENGKFLSSSFNPYITKYNIGYERPSNSFNLTDNCYWKNGTFDGGEFNISKWENGTFNSGNAVGMIWKNGIVNYMNAYNVFWENGLWRNGNWNGSYFNLTENGSVVDNYVLQILHNGMSFSATSSTHVWNVFYNESLSNSDTSNTTGFVFVSGTEDSPPTTPLTFSAVSSYTINITWKSTYTKNIMSFNTDLTPNIIDNDSMGSGFNAVVNVIKQQSNGKYICVGGFTTYQNVTLSTRNICRLNTDFTLDTSFTPPTFSSNLMTLEIDSSDRIYIGSSDTIGGKGNLCRLNANGTLDGGYLPGVGFNLPVTSIKLQPDGKLIVGGVFTTFNGVPANRLIRLGITGVKDVSFNGVNQGFVSISDLPRSIDLFSNGKIVIGGDFYSYNNFSCGNIIFLNSDGSVYLIPTDLDNSPGGIYSENVIKVLVDSTDRVYATGKFKRYGGGVTSHRIIRLTSLGIPDNTFNVSAAGLDNGTATYTTGGFNMLLNSSDNLVVVGNFGSAQGQQVPSICVLDDDGTISPGGEITTGSIDFTGGQVGIFSILDLGDRYIVGGSFKSYTNQSITEFSNNDRIGSDTTISTLLKSNINDIPSATWQISVNALTWTNITGVTNSNTYSLFSGDNYFRIENIVGVDSTYSNILKYTKI